MSAGADVMAANSDDWTPLHEVLRFRHSEVAQVLLSARSDVVADEALQTKGVEVEVQRWSADQRCTSGWSPNRQAV